jgi:sorbitol/mannitol transport system substrate-binding protein
MRVSSSGRYLLSCEISQTCPLKAMQTADPTNPGIKKVPYVGVQFVGIPEFQSIGLQVGQNIAAAFTGKMTVDQALQASQTEVERAVRQGGYLK